MDWPALGVDVGGTRVKFGLCDSGGRLLRKAEVDTPRAPEGLAGEIHAFVRGQGLSVRDLARIGVGVPGTVSGGRVWAVNLGWNGVELGPALEGALGVPVTLENDANAAAWGEHLAGAGRGVQDLVLVTLGTGVGCGIIAGGAVFRGASGQAGELGHITLAPDGELCTCGKRGCLETLIGSNGLWRRAGLEGPLEIRRIFTAAGDGDPRAGEVVRSIGTYLGIALSTVAVLLDPALILIGGGIAGAGDPLLRLVEAGLAAQLGSQIRFRPALKLAGLGNDAGVIGCALLSQRGAVRQ